MIVDGTTHSAAASSLSLLVGELKCFMSESFFNEKHSRGQSMDSLDGEPSRESMLQMVTNTCCNNLSNIRLQHEFLAHAA